MFELALANHILSLFQLWVSVVQSGSLLVPTLLVFYYAIVRRREKFPKLFHDFFQF